MPPVIPVTPDYLGYLYAGIVAAGGIAGYASKRSTMSLVAGLLFGGLLAVGSYLTSQDYRNVAVSALASAALSAVMGSRFFKSRKFMPAGMICLVSLVMLGRYALRLFV